MQYEVRSFDDGNIAFWGYFDELKDAQEKANRVEKTLEDRSKEAFIIKVFDDGSESGDPYKDYRHVKC